MSTITQPRLPDFGDYVLIEQKRFGAPNEMYKHKVIGRINSNAWIDVPAQTHFGKVQHDTFEEVVLVICCGVQEEKVERYRVADVRLVERKDAEADALDAARYRWLRDQHEGKDSGETFCVFAPDYGAHCLDPVGSLPGELDAAIDAEIAKSEGASHAD